ncbi:hypothetical protein ACT4ML_11065 [Natrinema sp. LN54]|uniref:hypothetical protein n=1 Tax=Natrinema sp. LN54 TaxID=3458705 RepID=UPI004035727F
MSQLALVPLQAVSEEMMLYYYAGTAVLLLISIGVAYWVYKDSTPRENNELAWSLGVGAPLFLFPPIGIIVLIVYYFRRSDATTAESVESESASGEW